MTDTYDPALDQEIQRTRERVRRAEHLAAKRRQVETELTEVGARVASLKTEFAAERRDVTRLENPSFTSLFARLAGKKEERLDRERAEADAVRLRLDGETRRHQQFGDELSRLLREQAELTGCEQEYVNALSAKEHAVREANLPAAAELTQIAQETADVHEHIREYDEAIAAGTLAGQAIQQTLTLLGGARNASTWDMLGGGSFADMVEHGKLNEAERAAWHAQQAIDRFCAELVDVGVQVKVAMPPIDTRWFADVFFDNVFTDYAKHERIKETGQAVQQVGQWLQSTLGQISNGRNDCHRRLDDLAARRARLLESG